MSDGQLSNMIVLIEHQWREHELCATERQGHVGSIAWNENGKWRRGNQNSEGSHVGGSDGGQV
jgi:hypothetical protein